jgi:hypothetical protein
MNIGGRSVVTSAPRMRPMPLELTSLTWFASRRSGAQSPGATRYLMRMPMPVYMDRHDLEKTTAESVAAAHLEDLKLQARFGCKAITYWFDEDRRTAFCLFEAPSSSIVRELHRAAHGQVPNEIIEVKRSDVLAYLGRVLDPDLAPGEPLHEPAFRTLMFTDIADSTGITAALGDIEALALIQKHHEAVRSALLDCGGQEVKTTGDGFLASFVSVESAVRCAREIQRGFDSMRPDANFRYWSELVWAQANPSLKMETCSGRW